MSLVEKVFQNLSERGDKSGNVDEEGFLVCDKCGKRKQCDVTVDINGINKTYRMPVACGCPGQCDIASSDKRIMDLKALRRDGLTDSKYYEMTFDKDDRRNPKISNACKRYVREWEEMKSENIGILLYGDPGTGKSFFACCIANALMEMGISAMVTSFPAILKSLQGFGEQQRQVYEKLKRPRLLVIDDLGVERDTPTALEQVYSVIDGRLLTKLPTIFTTNLDLSAIENPPDMTYKRIYSRVMEMCPLKLLVEGKDRRIESSSRREELAKQILRGESG